MKRTLLVLLLVFAGNFLFAQGKAELDYYVQEALKNSPLLKEYKNKIAQTELDSQRLKATYLPQLSAVSNNVIAPVLNGYGYDMALNNGGAFNEFLNLNKTFAGSHNLQSQYKSFQIQRDSLLNESKITTLDIVRTITNQYIIVFGDWQQYAFNLEVNSMLHKQELLLKTLTENNFYKQTDYLTFLVTLKQQELQIKQLKIQYRTDLSALNYMCGVFDTTNKVLVAPELVVEKECEENSSAFLQRYFYYSKDLQNDIDLLKYAYRPKLNAFANAGYSTSFIYDAGKNFGFSTGFTATVPIYDGHQKKIIKERNRLQQSSNKEYADFFLLQYRQQKAMLKQQLESTIQLISDINEQINYSKGLVDVNMKMLETGDVRIADYVIAINNYLTAKNLFTLNQINKWQIINQLNYWSK